MGAKAKPTTLKSLKYAPTNPQTNGKKVAKKTGPRESAVSSRGPKLDAESASNAGDSGEDASELENEELVKGEDSDEDDDHGDSQEEEDEDDGVDDEGMEKLMMALGDDLDDVGRVQLEVLNGAEDGFSESEESGSGDEEEEESQDEGGEKGGDEDGEEGEVELEDIESVDEDAVPRQKIVTNNKVRLTFLIYL